MKKMVAILPLIFMLIIDCVYAQTFHYYNGKPVEERIIDVNPTISARNDSSVKTLVEHCRLANINTIVLLVKYETGRIYYHSKRFKKEIAPEFEKFDVLKAMIKEAHKYGIKVHAWFCCLTEGTEGQAMKLHPEWAMLNPDGQNSAQVYELRHGKKTHVVWMDPSRRPGYVDQWLIPMMQEVAKNYDIDGINLDYYRYVGFAPDVDSMGNYSFDNYSLRNIPEYAHLYYEAFKDSVFSKRVEWNSVANVLPKGWFNWGRKQKAKFLLHGKYIPGGAADMNYFFYTYRTDAIKNFVKLVWEKVHSINPNIEISASPYKNPIKTGLFLGQRWTDFAPWVDIMMPMIYRSHFPKTNFNTFLKLFGEIVRKEYKWANNETNLAIQIDVYYIYREERLPPIEAIHEIDSLSFSPEHTQSKLVSEIKANYEKIKQRVERLDPSLSKEFSERLNNFIGKSEKGRKALKNLFNTLILYPPDGYYPKEKLERMIDTIRSAGGNGIAIFSAVGLTRKKLWPVLYKEFRKPSIEPSEIRTAGMLNVSKLRILERNHMQLKNMTYLISIIAAIFFIALVFLTLRYLHIKKKTQKS